MMRSKSKIQTCANCMLFAANGILILLATKYSQFTDKAVSKMILCVKHPERSEELAPVIKEAKSIMLFHQLAFLPSVILVFMYVCVNLVLFAARSRKPLPSNGDAG